MKWLTAVAITVSASSTLPTWIQSPHSHVVGMPQDEGAALLGELLEHATQPQFIYTHRWQPGDLVMWDNRCLLHRAVANYEMDRHRRVLHRTVIRGSVPF